MSWALPALAWFLSCLVAVAGMSYILIPALARWGRLDYPTERSSHTRPTLRGGGLAIVLVLSAPILFNQWLLLGDLRKALLFLLAFLLLAGVSWRDDRKSLPVMLRLFAQILAVIAGISASPSIAVLHNSIPLAVSYLVTGLLWIWFINLFNFMDGIDGLSGTETASIGAGVTLVIIATGAMWPMGWLAMALTGAGCGFLIWNWNPAKLFLGDVGSVPLGFLIGFVLLTLAANGQTTAAVILPLYYLVDSTTTLVARAMNREPVWRAHRTHAYQLAAAATSHRRVVTLILALNICLCGLSVISAAADNSLTSAATFVVGLILTVGLVLHFRSIGAPGRSR